MCHFSKETNRAWINDECLTDINATVGSDNTGREEIMEKHGIVVMNENGELYHTSMCI